MLPYVYFVFAIATGLLTHGLFLTAALPSVEALSRLTSKVAA
jgi:hypothetical protein